jgi:glutaredoxin
MNDRFNRCPKCGYVRKDTDIAPDWQCPACQVAYSKAAEQMHFPTQHSSAATGNSSQQEATGPGVLIVILLIVLIAGGGLFYLGNHFIKNKNIDSSQNSDVTASEKSVIIYTTTWCGVCKMAKGLLDRLDVKYEEYDVDTTDKGKQDYQTLEGQGVPIILIGGERIDGYDEDKIISLLKKKKIMN